MCSNVNPQVVKDCGGKNLYARTIWKIKVFTKQTKDYEKVCNFNGRILH